MLRGGAYMNKRGLFCFLIGMMSITFLLEPNVVRANIQTEQNWQRETIYYLMIDRFHNGDQRNDRNVNKNVPNSFFGGDFQGVIDQLDYVKDMGFTSILLTPVFKNDEHGYHGYWPVNYEETDEHFGSLEEMIELVEQVHERELKVIVHFPIYQTGKNHDWLIDSSKQDWLLKESEDELPIVNLDHHAVQTYFIETIKKWLTKTNLDGFLFSGIDHGPITFWNELAKEVKEVNGEALILGDHESPTNVADEWMTKLMFDGFLDYQENTLIRTAFSSPDQSTQFLSTLWGESKPHWQNPYLMGTFLDHDNMERFTNETIINNKHPGPRWKLALTYLYTTPGIPIVFYGSEIALAGGEAAENHQIMNFRTDKDLVEYVSKIGKLRSELPSLTNGTMELLYENNGMIIYKRVDTDETAVIVINNTSETQAVTLTSEQLEPGKELRGLLQGDLVRSNDKDEYDLVIDRELAEIYVLIEKTKMNLSFLVGIAAVWIVFILFLYFVWRRGKQSRQSS